MKVLRKARSKFMYLYSNLRGWKTNRKLLVLESDDWGALRQHSPACFQKLVKQGIPADKDPYFRYDGLETVEDLDLLCDTLGSVKNESGDSPVMTMNTIMANPDFDYIRKNKFEEYAYIDLFESYERYSEGAPVFERFKEGISQQLLQPQFHGREHLNVPQWLRALQKGDQNLMAAFAEDVYGAPASNRIGDKANPTVAFDSVKSKDLQFYEKAVQEGLGLFEKYFDFQSQTMIAPSYTWNEVIERSAHRMGVEAFQGIRVQYEPTPAGPRKPVFRYTGQRNERNQMYIIRNAFFEPSLEGNAFKSGNTLRQIKQAFQLRQPAILSSHRINFVGRGSKEKRNENLRYLKKILKKVVDLYPEVEFISTDRLNDIIQQSAN